MNFTGWYKDFAGANLYLYSSVGNGFLLLLLFFSSFLSFFLFFSLFVACSYRCYACVAVRVFECLLASGSHLRCVCGSGTAARVDWRDCESRLRYYWLRLRCWYVAWIFFEAFTQSIVWSNICMRMCVCTCCVQAWIQGRVVWGRLIGSETRIRPFLLLNSFFSALSFFLSFFLSLFFFVVSSWSF